MVERLRLPLDQISRTVRRTRPTELRNLARESLRLALDYQSRYPETEQGRKVHGRIRADKRAQFTSELAGFIVKDKRLLQYIVDRVAAASGGNGFDDQRDRIADYLVHTHGSVQEALEKVESIFELVIAGYGDSRQLIQRDEITRLAAFMRLSTPEETVFQDQMHHMVNEAREVLRGTVDALVDILCEREGQILDGAKELLREAGKPALK